MVFLLRILKEGGKLVYEQVAGTQTLHCAFVLMVMILLITGFFLIGHKTIGYSLFHNLLLLLLVTRSSHMCYSLHCRDVTCYFPLPATLYIIVLPFLLLGSF